MSTQRYTLPTTAKGDLNMPKPDDIAASWAFLEIGLNAILEDFDSGMEYDSYMAVYTVVHNFCTSQKASPNHMAIASSGTHRGAHLLGEDLYRMMIGYLDGKLKAINAQAAKHSDEALLQYYIKEWKRYTEAGKYIHHMFFYLNRHWVKREIDEGKKNTYVVYTLFLVQWRMVFFDEVKGPLMNAILKLVEAQRNGDTIEYNQIKQASDSFVALGIDETSPEKTNLECWGENFEKPFLAATEAFYKKESNQFLTENSVVEYLKKAETRLAEEEERVGLYLHSEITDQLKKTCNKALITDHADLIRDEFPNLLDNDREDDMARMYDLLARIDNGLDPLRTKFEAHVRNAGLAAVAKVAQEGDKLEPKAYVEALLGVHRHYQGLVKRAFKDEPEFTRSLDNACREFVNRNDVCKSGNNKSPELLAKYSDVLLKKGPTAVDDTQLQATLNELMTVFKFIEDKDVFQKYYSRMLARRLVHGNSTSEHAETVMISNLKEASGFEYTNKLGRMMTDMKTSKELNDSYESHQGQLGEGIPVNSNYSILGTGFWPLTAPTTNFTPGDEITAECNRFARFYKHKHDGRKLTWLWNLCKGEMRASFYKGKQPIIYIVSAYQMAILLLFNEKDSCSYTEISEATSLSPEALDPALTILIKARVLSIAKPNWEHPAAGDVYDLVMETKQKKVRVNLNIATKTETKHEEVETNKTIEDDRKLVLQSAIVRVMKARKKLKHNQLVSETISQTRHRFVPKVADIKKCIEILVDKEYLERLDDDELGYLA